MPCLSQVEKEVPGEPPGTFASVQKIRREFAPGNLLGAPKVALSSLSAKIKQNKLSESTAP